MSDEKGIEESISVNPASLIVCGYTPDGTKLHPNHLITIYSSYLNCIIQAPIQDTINISTSSNWDKLAVSELTNGLNNIIPAIFGTTLQTTYLSRRRWTGSSPMKMKLKLKFMLYDDVTKNVIMPSTYLQQMNLPFVGSRNKWVQNGMDWLKNKTGIDVPFLAPPGPNPWSLSNTAFQNAPKGSEAGKFQEMVTKADEFFGKGDVITIQYGNFLSLTNCVFTDVSVNYDNAREKSGQPIGAEVTVNFQTYEIMTKDSIADIYLRGVQDDIGNEIVDQVMDEERLQKSPRWSSSVNPGDTTRDAGGFETGVA